MRKAALISLVLDTLDNELGDDLADVRQNLIDSQQADPEGAFGAFCYRLDEAAGGERAQVESHLTSVLEAISEDSQADKIAAHPEPWSILTAIVRDGDY